MRPLGATKAGLELITSLAAIVISPPVTEKVFPSCTSSQLPWIVIPAGLLCRNPKATGGATVNVLFSDLRCGKVVEG
jgi:hypothetical protein